MTAGAHLAVPQPVGPGPWRRTLAARDDLHRPRRRDGVEHDVREYPDAGHSFMNRHDLGPGGALLRVAGVGFHEPPAQDAWGRILRFFEDHPRT